MTNLSATAKNNITLASWSHQHLTSIEALSSEDIQTVFNLASDHRAILHAPRKYSEVLLGKTVANLFYENSTRTRCSFELAAKYLGAHVVNLDVATSSAKKGETLDDTIETLLAMGTDAIVLRHQQSGLHEQLAQRFGKRFHLLNAGDGCHQHPSQALLDAFTLFEYWGSELKNFNNKCIVIVGDIRHSRVARSNIQLLSKLGVHVICVGPATLLPPGLTELGCETSTDLNRVLPEADVVMALRVQQERQSVQWLPSLSEYAREYGLSHERLAQFAKPDCKVMHPMPLNRGVEMTSELADDTEHCLMFKQVENGVLVRMALLELLLTSGGAN